MGAGGTFLVEEISGDWREESSLRWDDIKLRTLDWKAGVVMGLVSMSYWNNGVSKYCLCRENIYTPMSWACRSTKSVTGRARLVSWWPT